MTLSSFTGEYPGVIDQKGRVSIPSKLRKLFPENVLPVFMVTKWLDPCLVAYPVEEWNKMAEKLMQMSMLRRKNRAFIRAFVRNAVQLECDKQGRIAIPKRLAEMVGLKKNVLMIGALNKIEIWNPEKFEEYEMNQVDLGDEQFEDLGDSILL